MNTRPKFYVLPIEDEDIRDCLDGIRLLCNPNEKYQVHLTVRGPYSPNSNQPNLSKLVNVDEIQVTGIGNFFDFNQNTVFLSCNSLTLSKIWWKPDYPFNPHITLYDGTSREFAIKLFELLSKHDIHFTFHSSELVPLSRQTANESFWLKLAEERISLLLGTPVDFSKAVAHGSIAVLRLIDEIVELLCERSRIHGRNLTYTRIGIHSMSS